MAEEEFAVGVAQVHAVAEAPAPMAAAGAGVGFHPGAVAVDLVAVVPYVHEVVAFIYIALAVVGPDAGTGGDRAVGHNGTNGEASVAQEEVVADIALIFPEEAFAAVASLDAALLAGTFYEFHRSAELFAGKPQFGITGCTADGEYRKQPPLLEAILNEQLLDAVKLLIAALVHTGHYVELDLPGIGDHIDCGNGLFIDSR